MRSVAVADKRRHSGTYFDMSESEDKPSMCGSPTKSEKLISTNLLCIICITCCDGRYLPIRCSVITTTLSTIGRPVELQPC